MLCNVKGRRLRWYLLAGIAGFLGLNSACIDDLEPDVGPLLSELCVDEDSDPNQDVSYSVDIDEGIFRADVGECLGCHSPDGETPIGFEVSGLDLSSHPTLRTGGSRSGRNIVVPGRPCQSILVQKLAPGPPFGARMPLGGQLFLSAEQRQLLHDWIVEGANDN